MAIIGMEGSLVLAFLIFVYNMSLGTKLMYDTLTKKEFEKPAWSLASGVMTVAGSLMMFLWFFNSFAPTVGWLGFIGSLFIFVNNLLVTIFTFMKSIKTTTFGKIGNVLFTLLALWTFLLLLQKVAVSTGFGLPRFLDWILVWPTIGYTMFQGLLFGPISYHFPILILIPLCVPIKFVKEEEIELIKTKEKPIEETKRGKAAVFLERPAGETPQKRTSGGFVSFLDNGSKMIIASLVIMLLVFNIMSLGNVISFGEYTSKDYNPSFLQRTDMELGVYIQSASYQIEPTQNFNEIFQKELVLMKELNVTVARIDLKVEFLENYSSHILQIVDDLKTNGIKVMFATYGYDRPTWNLQNVSFEDFTEGINQQAIDIVNITNPDYILIYPEPYGYSTYFLSLEEEITVSMWVNKINNTIEELRSISNDTKIGINLSENSLTVDTDLFEPLWTSTPIDFIGVDFYPFYEKHFDISYFLDRATNSSKEFWFTEFGISAMVFGEKIQAGALTYVLEQCVNNPLVKGFIYYSLMDQTIAANSLGLVAETGYKRDSFEKYKEIIQKVKGLS